MSEQTTREIADAIGAPDAVILGGKEWRVTGLDFNDLADLETRYGGGPEMLDLGKITDQRFILWLALRKADPALSDDHRERCDYLLTETQVGKMISFKDTPEAVDAVLKILRLSGLLPDQGEEDAANPTPAAGKPPKKTRTQHSASASDGTGHSS